MEENLIPSPGKPEEEGLVDNLYYWLQTLALAVTAIVLLFTFVGRISRVEGGSMLNTLWISLLVSVLQGVSCTLVAYGFARYQFPLKKFWFACVVLLIIVPPTTIQTSLYMYFANFDILGIFKAINGKPINLRTSIIPYAMMSLTCMGLKNGLYIYMLRQYFRGVPKSLEEAAKGVEMVRSYTPNPSARIEEKYRKFCKLYEAALEIARM